MIKFKDLLIEYRGENFMKPILNQLVSLEKERDRIRQLIKTKKLQDTSTDRQFKYVEEFLDKAIRYTRLGIKSLEQIGADK